MAARSRSDRRLGREPGLDDRAWLLLAYDRMSDDGRMTLLFLARAIVREEGLAADTDAPAADSNTDPN